MDTESETSFQDRKQRMRRATFTFGAGPRTCIGKNISLLEIYKIELNYPSAEWEIVNAWLVRQKNMDVRLTHNSEAIARS
ncbi:hypothetical protein N7527_005794 [Penicillium freii]|nr:hypothetical protein N7527_005794 [Penicillium freii]